MKLVVIILNKTEHLEDLLSAFLEIGVSAPRNSGEDEVYSPGNRHGARLCRPPGPTGMLGSGAFHDNPDTDRRSSGPVGVQTERTMP